MNLDRWNDQMLERWESHWRDPDYDMDCCKWRDEDEVEEEEEE